MRTTFFIIAALLSAGLKAQNPAVFANQSARPPAQPGQERHFLRAPDVIPGTLPEMRDPNYWIARMAKPDQVVMTAQQITQANHAFGEKVKHPDRIDTLACRLILAKIEAYPGLFFSKPDPYTQSIPIAALIANEIKYMRHTEYGNTLGIQYSSSELDKLETEMNAPPASTTGAAPGATTAPRAPGATPVQSGLITEAVCLRIVPQISPEYVGQPDKNRTRWDVWNLDVLSIGSAVQVLHSSRSGAFLFVLSDNGYGWVPAEKVALADRATIDKFVNATHFVVCTGDKVPFFADRGGKYASGAFRMGDRLPLATSQLQAANSLLAAPHSPQAAPHKILVPIRQANGSLSIQQAWLISNADIHVGYLPYTRRNVVGLSFKLLDNIYDWTGAWLGRNHATMLRDIFACFGFRLPSCGELLSVYNDHTKWLSAKTPKEDQYKAALANEPFLTLQICSSGHSNLFLGNYEGTPINYDTHGYNYTDSTGRSFDIRRVCVETIAIPDYFLKQDVTFVELK